MTSQTPTQLHDAVSQAIEHWNSGNLAGYLKLYDTDVVLHGFPPGLPPGAIGAKLFYEGIWAAFPGSQIVVEDVIVEGDKLACRFVLQAIHQGEFMGIPPTNKAIRVSGMSILRFSSGRCVERWNQADMLGWLQQLGAIPMPA